MLKAVGVFYLWFKVFGGVDLAHLGRKSVTGSL